MSDVLLKKIEMIGASFSKAIAITIWDEMVSNVIPDSNDENNPENELPSDEDYPMEDYVEENEANVPGEGDEQENGINVNAAWPVLYNNKKEFQNEEDDNEANWPIETLDES